MIDEARRSPIVGATAVLLEMDSSEVASAETGSDGFFTLSAEAPGAYLVRVVAGGYAPAEQRVELRGGRLTVPAFAVNESAIPVPGVDVDVDGRRLPGRAAGPSARPAYVLAGERLAELDDNGVSFTGAVQGIKPGIIVRTIRRAGGLPLPCVETHRSLPDMRGYSRGGCRWVAIVVDGVNTRMSGDEADLFVKGLRLADWESIEFLAGVEAMRYGLDDSGALVLWTRGRGPHRSEARGGGGR